MVSTSKSKSLRKTAVFIDRDGVINENRPDYVKSWAEFRFLSGSLKALKKLAVINWPLVVVSNQSAIGRGLVSAAVVDEINAHMVADVRQAGGRIDSVYICPHRPDEDCECRKPKPGLFYQAANDLELDLSHCYLIGDAVSDIQAGLAAGVKPILVLSGRGPEQYAQLVDLEGKFLVTGDLDKAVNYLIAQQ